MLGSAEDRTSESGSTAMGKLKKVASALGSLGDVSNAREKFDNSTHVFPDSSVISPEDIRPAAPDARTLLMRITTAEASERDQAAASAQGDTFAVIHIPAGKNFAVVLVLNPSTQIDFVEGTNHIDGESTAVFLWADPVDDAGNDLPEFFRYLVSWGH